MFSSTIVVEHCPMARTTLIGFPEGVLRSLISNLLWLTKEIRVRLQLTAHENATRVDQSDSPTLFVDSAGQDRVESRVYFLPNVLDDERLSTSDGRLDIS